MGDAGPDGAALQQSPWRKRIDLSSGLKHVESFLSGAGFDRAPWAVVALCSGIAAWFVLPTAWHWLAWLTLCLAIGLLTLAVLRADGRFPYLRQAVAVVFLVSAAGMTLIWAKSELVGTRPITQPTVTTIAGTLLDRQEQPAQGRVRLVLATRDPDNGRAIKVRVNLPLDRDRPELTSGATVTLRARLVPPAPPMLPGGYDFARTAWFSGLAATGSVLGDVAVASQPPEASGIWRIQQALSRHVRSKLDGSPGTIAAAFASGDRGSIAKADEDAMRDAGLTHLLSISGLHVSAVIAAAYVLALRLLGLFPWLALRVRLPLVAAAAGAMTGVGYTLLTGAEVPTIRSCVGAVLVLIALALGREALSMRMVAVGAGAILLLWPEALVGPSFQMSFAAVIAIVALHGAPRVRALFQAREEPWYAKLGRQVGSLLLTGIVIELALMPIGLFHFHRAGVYGALANVVAIPLTTFVSMPLIALALLLDTVGLGDPLWWLAGKSLELLLALAHWTASFPGAVTMLPSMGGAALALFVAGGLWLALWSGKARLFGLVPAILGALLIASANAPDILVTGDGRYVGITGEGEELLVLRDSRSEFVRDNLAEQAGMDGEARLIADWPGAICNADFCALRLERGVRAWDLLLARRSDYVDERALAAACDRSDVVIAPRYLPRSCQPRWIKADRRLLDQTGGMAIDLSSGRVRTVAQEQGRHGWWERLAPFQNDPSARNGKGAPQP